MYFFDKPPVYDFMSDAESQSFIKKGLKNGNSFSRIGLTELKLFFSIKRYRINGLFPLFPRKYIVNEGQKNAGIYFINRAEQDQFVHEMETTSTNCNMASLPSIYYNKFSTLVQLNDQFNQRRLKLRHYEPYLFENNYFDFFSNTNVTIVTSFAKTASDQIDRFQNIHKNITTACNFHIVKAPQTNAQYEHDGVTFFQRLDALERQVCSAGNNFVLVGAGGYGHLLAKRLSRKGYVVMVIGGGIQILFGIIGKRWENREDFREMFNEHWTKPHPNDVPKGFNLVENGCYW